MLLHNVDLTDDALELIAERYERRSLMITANQPFSGWNDVFPDPSMTVAAIDRLVHHAEILSIKGESYRRKEAQEHAAANARKRKAKGAP